MTTPRPGPALLLFERGLLATRWLLAPFYVGIAAGLVMLLGVFGVTLVQGVAHLLATAPDKLAEAGVLLALSLIDQTLIANLLVIVILSGYENFISRLATPQDPRRPSWMGAIDYADLKMKLIASVLAISAVALLRTYLELGDHHPDSTALAWQIGIIGAFAVVGLALAAMDWIASLSPSHNPVTGNSPPP